ncbi:MAG TPA: hypothetical protein VEG63_10560 [Candidatus Acidoferrales bacterium]|nr:hypothetical protein [Candidatus Acidoferrales bacterium]
MADDDLDRILAEEQEIVPSAGFVRSVMKAVEREAATPSAIPFPWKWALPGMAGDILALGWAFVLAVQLLHGSMGVQAGPVATPPVITKLVESVRMTGAGWIALSLVLSLASVKLSSRLAA